MKGRVKIKITSTPALSLQEHGDNRKPVAELREIFRLSE